MGRRMKGTQQGDTTRGHNSQGGAVSRGYAESVADALRNILADPTATGAARAAAARTLAEINGLIGRHSTPPVDKAQAARVSLLSRAELERELARLRAACAGDTRGDSA